MAGGNPPKPSPSSFSAHPDYRKSQWESSSSSAAAKSNPSPKPTPTPQNYKDLVPKPPIAKPKPRPENPSPRPENPSSFSGPRPIFPLVEPPPLPSYGFHMLERRSMVLADGSVRSYFALPLDYENFKPMPRPIFRPEFPGPLELGLHRPHVPMSPDFHHPDVRVQRPEYWNSWKRKFGEEERDRGDDGLERQRQRLLHYGNANRTSSSAGHSLGTGEEMRATKSMRIHEGNVSKLKHSEVDQSALKKAFLHFVKLVFENPKKIYLADGKQGPVSCMACSRSSKEFQDTHSLVMHAYNPESTDSLVDHLAFHKALCVVMGWNYLMPPDNTKAYQKLTADEAEANQDDLIMWPPSVLVHNTIKGKGSDGRMEGIGNRSMDGILRDLGFTGCKSVSLYAREGHLGIHAVKFSSDGLGLKEASRLAEYFEREMRGRKAWTTHLQSSRHGKDDENNPNLLKRDPKTGEKMRVLYGHMGTVVDLEKVTLEIKKKASIVSKRECMQSK